MCVCRLETRGWQINVLTRVPVTLVAKSHVRTTAVIQTQCVPWTNMETSTANPPVSPPLWEASSVILLHVLTTEYVGWSAPHFNHLIGFPYHPQSLTSAAFLGILITGHSTVSPITSKVPTPMSWLRATTCWPPSHPLWWGGRTSDVGATGGCHSWIRCTLMFMASMFVSCRRRKCWSVVCLHLMKSTAYFLQFDMVKIHYLL